MKDALIQPLLNNLKDLFSIEAMSHLQVPHHAINYGATSVFLGTMSILLLTYAFLVLRSKKPFIQNLYEIEEEEFDFMSTEESKHSQLDLASAYIDMIQLDEAKRILDDLRHISKHDQTFHAHFVSIEKRLAKAYRAL